MTSPALFRYPRKDLNSNHDAEKRPTFSPQLASYQHPVRSPPPRGAVSEASRSELLLFGLVSQTAPRMARKGVCSLYGHSGLPGRPAAGRTGSPTPAKAGPGERLQGTADRPGPASSALPVLSCQPGLLSLWPVGPAVVVHDPVPSVASQGASPWYPPHHSTPDPYRCAVGPQRPAVAAGFLQDGLSARLALLRCLSVGIMAQYPRIGGTRRSAQGALRPEGGISLTRGANKTPIWPFLP